MQRVTTLGSTTNSKVWIDVASKRLQQGEQRVATGLRFERVSEAPADAAALLRTERSLGRLEQLDRNADNARLWLNTVHTALNDSVDTMTRARTRLVQGANDTNTSESRQAIAADIRAAADELLSLANTSVNGRPIFAGTSGGATAYDSAGNYLGDGGGVVRSISSTDSFTVAAPGPLVFGTFNGASPYAGTAFQVLRAAADAVEIGDVAGARAGLEAIDAATGRVQSEIGRAGSLAARLDEIQIRNEDSKISLKSQISELVDVDLAEGIMDVKAAETSYEATLSAASRSLGRSLLDFLR